MAADDTERRLRAAVEADAPRIRADLERLVRIPSVAFDGFPPEPLSAAAEAVAELLREAGDATVREVEVPGDPPSVYAELPGPPGAPVVLLYAHYDVQPAPPEGWTSDPFEPVERDGRLYGRGAADDKSGVVAHLAALRAWRGEPPVTLKLLFEGGEENGKQRLPKLIDGESDLLRADWLVIGDGGNWRLGEPTLSQSLRGHGKLTLELRTLRGALHSGQFGGAAPDALLALTRLLASLHDDRGAVAVAGLHEGEWPGARLPEEDFRRQAEVLDGVELVGGGTVSDRLWARHAISVLGLDAPAVETAGNIVIPAARAKVAVRVPPGADPQASMEAVQRHLEARVPWGAHLSIEVEPASTPVLLDADAAAERALAAAFGKPVARMGTGGSIPLVARLHEAYPEATIVIWGAQDSDAAHIHAANESVDLSELGRIALAEALLLAEISA